MKAAMKDKDKDRLSTLRLILAEFKRIEVDERIEMTDELVLAVLEKMMKKSQQTSGRRLCRTHALHGLRHRSFWLQSLEISLN